MRQSYKARLAKIQELLEQYGDLDGAHHKQWVLDQIARVVLGDEYDEWAAASEDADAWDTGVAP
jgi:hypothetical protein